MKFRQDGAQNLRSRAPSTAMSGNRDCSAENGGLERVNAVQLALIDRDCGSTCPES